MIKRETCAGDEIFSKHPVNNTYPHLITTLITFYCFNCIIPYNANNQHSKGNNNNNNIIIIIIINNNNNNNNNSNMQWRNHTFLMGVFDWVIARKEVWSVTHRNYFIILRVFGCILLIFFHCFFCKQSRGVCHPRKTSRTLTCTLMYFMIYLPQCFFWKDGPGCHHRKML